MNLSQNNLEYFLISLLKNVTLLYSVTSATAFRRLNYKKMYFNNDWEGNAPILETFKKNTNRIKVAFMCQCFTDTFKRYVIIDELQSCQTKRAALYIRLQCSKHIRCFIYPK